MNPIIQRTLVTLAIICMATVSLAQGPGRGQGRGFGRGAGGQGHGPGGPGGARAGAQRAGAQRAGAQGAGAQGAGHAHDERHDADHEVLQFLLTNHQKIQRKVIQLPDGVETLTESNDPEIADKIKEHVSWMEYRIKETNPIRMRDPLFRELFQHTDKIVMKHEDTEKGVRVIETSTDPYVAKLIKAHAEVVSGFVARGFAEAMKNHPVPGNEDPPIAAPVAPVIKGHGKVVRLPSAVHQPRDGSKIVVDLTRGGDPGKLNPGIEKLARYVNIYQGAGRESASVSIAVVLHGDATLTVLNADAYAERFPADENPNFDLLHQLHEAGVEIFVCGQSLVAKGAKPEEVVVFADTAVSALTAVVNLQADGYSYVPLSSN